MPKDTHQPGPTAPPLSLPEQVSVALAELAGAAREGLLALAVGTGLQVLQLLMEEDVARLSAPGAATTPTGSRSATAPTKRR
jgi:putative transposase